jgi:endoglucanase
MERRELLQLAERVLRLPTAPYHEHRVKSFVTGFCRGLRGVRIEEDRVGNVIAKYVGAPFRAGSSRSRAEARSYRVPPLVFVAHMDHPGFEMLGGRRAEFFGGVPKEMFKDARVRVYTDLECGGSTPPFSRQKRQGCVKPQHSIIRATVSRMDDRRWPRRKMLTLDFEPGTVNRPRRGDIGMWDVPAFRVTGGKLHAAAIDDVLGTVVALGTLAEVSRRKLRAHLWCAFTRAEEVGFQGAMALVRANKIPRSALVVSIEMSKERPWARIGDGPIVRVGDRATIFDPAASAFLWRVAERCRTREHGFQAQRCLMDGGTCEATVFAACGYRAGGLCLPLGNYHNIGRNLRPRAEYVSVRDLEQLVRLTVAAAEEWRNFGETTTALRRRVLGIMRGAPRPLRKTMTWSVRGLTLARWLWQIRGCQAVSR